MPKEPTKREQLTARLMDAQRQLQQYQVDADWNRIEPQIKARESKIADLQVEIAKLLDKHRGAPARIVEAEKLIEKIRVELLEHDSRYQINSVVNTVNKLKALIEELELGQ